MAARFQDARDLEVYLASMMEDTSSDESEEDELLLLYDAALKEGQGLHGRRGMAKLELSELSLSRSDELFRFTPSDIYRLTTALDMPVTMYAPNRWSWSCEEGLAILLRRFVYPNRLSDVADDMGRGEAEISLIVNHTVEFLDRRWGYLFKQIDQPWLTHDRLESYCDAVLEQTNLYDNVWGFIDGTVRPMCRPIHGQRLFYNGHKRVHSLKFQCISCPDGMIPHLFGPVEGKKHDSSVLDESGLLRQLNASMRRNATSVYSVYGDPAYPSRPQILSPYRNPVNQGQRDHNKAMSGVRQSVEWCFGNISTLFAFLDFKKNMKVLLSPIGVYYRIGALLANCHNCLHRNEISQKFNIQPPQLEEYLQ